MVLVIFRRCENKMKRLLMLCCLVLAGCGEPSGEDQSLDEIIEQVNASGTITDEQAESLSKVGSPIHLCGLTAISDEQAKILSRLNGLALNSLTSITDLQAESLSKVETLFLTGLIAINDEQAKSLAKVDFFEISEACQPLIDKYKKQ